MHKTKQHKPKQCLQDDFIQIECYDHLNRRNYHFILVAVEIRPAKLIWKYQQRIQSIMDSSTPNSNSFPYSDMINWSFIKWFWATVLCLQCMDGSSCDCL